MKRIIIVMIAILIMMCGTMGYAANWYVDNAATGSATGTSWTNAWKSFAGISWSSMACGDTLYISGGSSSKTYNERLNVGKSCTSESPLTITVGTDTGHNGTVVIKGQSGGYTGIQISSKNYITIDGQSGGDGQRHIEITGAKSGVLERAVNVTGTSKGAVLKYLYIHDAVLTSQSSYQAILFDVSSTSYAVDHEVAYCQINSNVDCIHCGDTNGVKPTGYGGFKVHDNILVCADDGITSDGGVDIYNNDFSRQGDGSIGHPDGIQIYGSYARIYNNYFHDFQATTGGNSVVYWEPDGGENMNVNEYAPSNFWLYNNLFWETGTATNVCAIELGLSDSRWTSVHDVYILNNTVYGAYTTGLTIAFACTLDKSAVYNFYVENNIFTSAVKSGSNMWNFARPKYTSKQVDIGSHGSKASMIFDANIYTGTGSSYITLDGAQYTPTNFNGTFSAHSTYFSSSDPSLSSSGKPSTSSATPVGNALLWTSDYHTDKGGTNRGSSWDIGAYEHTLSAPSIRIY